MIRTQRLTESLRLLQALIDHWQARVLPRSRESNPDAFREAYAARMDRLGSVREAVETDLLRLPQWRVG